MDPAAAAPYVVEDPVTSDTSSHLSTYVDTDTYSPANMKAFVDRVSPSLYILTPCYGGMLHVPYAVCLMKTLDMCRTHGIQVRIEFCRNDSLVTRARNNLIAKAMSDPTMTHVMFIDADISWDPMDIIKLLMAEKPVVGGVYPLKNYLWDKLRKDAANPYNTNVIQGWLARRNTTPLKDLVTEDQMVRHNLVKYNLNYVSPNVKIENNLCEVRHIATGFMMIQRDVLTQMMTAYPETKYEDDVGFLQTPEENQHAYALFDCRVDEGHYLSEDWFFCHQWSKLGGQIFINIAVNLTHTGTEDYMGSYLSTIL